MFLLFILLENLRVARRKWDRMTHRNRALPYNPILRPLARELRKNGTYAEVVLWRALKSRSLGLEFHRQVPVHEFIVDFLCHERMLAVEVDGYTHTSADAHERDEERDRRLAALGLQVLRFPDARVLKDLRGVLKEISEVLENEE